MASAPQDRHGAPQVFLENRDVIGIVDAPNRLTPAAARGQTTAARTPVMSR
jgi:hypothetical protein